MICWYCYWGWPKEITAIYEKWKLVAGESALHFGPAHIVWEDENFERHHVQWCLDHFDDNVNNGNDEERYSKEELVAVKRSLQELLMLPNDILESIPEEYDEEHPEWFPPMWCEGQNRSV